MEYANILIERRMREAKARKVLDIGCGIGGSLVYLSSRTDAVLYGITVSPVQRDIGCTYIRQAGCGHRCTIIEGDYLAAVPQLDEEKLFDFTFAIESFLHMKSADSFFARTKNLLADGGQVLILDDFLEKGPGDLSRSADTAGYLDRFKRGWQVKNLISVEETIETARGHGFTEVERMDLSPFLELRRPRDRIIRLILVLFGRMSLRSPFWLNMYGGDALQQLLLKKIVGYHFLRFVKRDG